MGNRVKHAFTIETFVEDALPRLEPVERLSIGDFLLCKRVESFVHQRH